MLLPCLPKVSVVIITYERFALLKRTVLSFRQNTAYPNVEIIVTDDGSSPNTLRKIEQLPIDQLVQSPKRKSGLGANTNRGIRAATGDFILQLQDDFDCNGPSNYLQRAVAVFEMHEQLGMVRLFGINAEQHCWTEPDQYGFSLLLRPSSGELKRQQLYSDLPHLKSRSFMQELGYYREGCRMEETETDYVRRFLQQREFEIGFFPDLNNGLFQHTGETSSFRTSSLRNRMQERLADVAGPLKKSAPAVHRMGRALWRKLSGQR